MEPVVAVPEATKPETAYELLEAVARHIEEEPRRYNQSHWVLRGADIAAEGLDVDPPCGTVCCRAGWIVALGDPVVFKTADPETISTRANQLLGLDEVLLWHELFSTMTLETGAHPGTQEYANAGAAGVREFMAQYEDHLKARKLTV